MQFDGIKQAGAFNVSSERCESGWLRISGDPLVKLRAYRAAGPLRYTIDGAGYELTLGPDVAGLRRVIEFRWMARGVSLQPPLRGTIAATRVGPFVALVLRAQYAFATDVASRLMHEAAGENALRRTSKYVLNALCGSLGAGGALDLDA